MPKSIIVGTVATDPKQKTVAKKNGENISLTTLIVLTSEINDKNSQLFPVEVWGKAANHIFESAKKGSLVKVECSILNNDYKNKNGQQVYGYRFVADSMPVILRSSKTMNKETVKQTEAQQESPIQSTNGVSDDDFKFGNQDNSFNF